MGFLMQPQKESWPSHLSIKCALEPKRVWRDLGLVWVLIQVCIGSESKRRASSMFRKPNHREPRRAYSTGSKTSFSFWPSKIVPWADVSDGTAAAIFSMLQKNVPALGAAQCVLSGEKYLFCVFTDFCPLTTLVLPNIGHLVVQFFLARCGTQERLLVGSRSAGVQVLV